MCFNTVSGFHFEILRYNAVDMSNVSFLQCSSVGEPIRKVTLVTTERIYHAGTIPLEEDGMFWYTYTDETLDITRNQLKNLFVILWLVISYS